MKLLVLVVEDNEDSRYLLEKILQGYGHKVMAAANGAEALQQALAQPPDIIISDIMMPKMDGYQLCRECKQNEQLKNIPFVFYPSTYTREEDEKFALSLGGAAFVAKPTEPAVLVQMLSEIVEKAESGALAPPKITPLESSLFLTEYTKRIFTKLESTVAQLEIEITERRQAEHNLNERMKELECLYSISKITERAGINLDETYQEVTNLIPQGWQYPDITCARVTIKGNEFITPNFRETDWKQDSDIIVDGQRIGVVKVYYLEEKPECDEGPFLKEERNLINGITNQLESSIQRKQAEKELRESEERYSALMNLGAEVGEAVVMLQDTEREEGLHTFVNDEWSHITGYSMEELLNMSFLNLIHPKDREVSLERHQGKMSGKAMPGLFEMTIIRKDGTEVLIELTSAYTTYKGKRANVAYMRDITERKKMEEQLIVTDRLASIGELSSGIAHELNNPLTSVIGFSELLLDKELPDDTRKDLEIINREAKRTAGVVRNLLTFARKHESENQSVDI